MKRVVDLCGALIGLIILTPLFGGLWLAVMAESGRPGLFRHRRVGRGGREFDLLKFRSMTVKPGTELGAFEAGNKSRVTRLGRILRKTKLDELPQLWNVLKGDMSFVGPRPEVQKWVDAYPERWAKVLTVRPGITDPASIEYRNEEDILAAALDPERTYREEILPRKLDLYERYVRERSGWGDLMLMARTARAVVKTQNGSAAG